MSLIGLVHSLVQWYCATTVAVRCARDTLYGYAVCCVFGWRAVAGRGLALYRAAPALGLAASGLLHGPCDGVAVYISSPLSPVSPVLSPLFLLSRQSGDADGPASLGSCSVAAVASPLRLRSGSAVGVPFAWPARSGRPVRSRLRVDSTVSRDKSTGQVE